MRLSIALCSYNGERFIAEQLDSFLAQQRLPDQIIICDDGSSDRTVAICQAFAERAAPLGVVVQVHVNRHNLGYVRNFERALSLCDGDLIFLSDQDDVWHPEKLMRYEQRFEAEPDLLLLHSDATLVDGDLNPLGCGLFESLEITDQELSLVHAGRAMDALLLRNLVTGATAAFRRALVARALPIKPGWIHDEWLGIVAAASGGRVDCLEWSSMAYRQHGGNQIGARLRTPLEKLRAPESIGSRRAFLGRSADRLDVLRNRVMQVQWVDDTWLSDLNARIDHLRCRSQLPVRWYRRIPVVLRQQGMGNYARYGSGWRSFLADMAGLA